MISSEGEFRNGKKYAELVYLLLISGNSGVQKRMAYLGIVPYTLLRRFSKETTVGLGRITEEGTESYLHPAANPTLPNC